MEFTNIGFIGFGLIAGSIAKAIRLRRPDCHITALSRSVKPLEDALKDGNIDVIARSVEEDFKECDLIFLCTPVSTIPGYLAKLKTTIKNGCIITDVGSVKSTIHEAVNKLGMQDCFIGGHPMAGTEKKGYANSSSNMIKGALYVITPTEKTTPEALRAYKDFVNDFGMRFIVMDYHNHDIAASAISHVPHLAAACLCEVVMMNENKGNEKYMHQLAAGGFLDTTRIAASTPEMWQQICAENTDNITMMLGEYIDKLKEVKDNLEKGNHDFIGELFEKSGDYRRSYN